MVERTLPKPDTRVRFPSAAPQAPDLTVWGFLFGLDVVVRLRAWVERVEAVCSLLLQGTRPRFASDTLMSRRNIPASPLLIPSPLREGGVVSAGCNGDEPWETQLGKSVRGGGEGNTRVRYRKQLAREQDRYLGAVVSPYGRSGPLPEGSSRQGLL